MQDCGMEVKIIEEQKGPFRDYYFEDQVFMNNIEKFPGAYEKINDKYIKTLVAFEATLPKQ